MILPDSARVEVTDSYLPRARPLNGAGDSVAAPVFWASLDPAILEVLDSTTGVSLAKAVGTGRLQARVESIRTAPQAVTVLSHLESLAASGPTTRDSVVAPDSVSNGLSVQATATGGEAVNRRVVYAMTVYPATGSTVTFVPNDTVFTSSLGVASVQLKYLAGTLPDSVVVTACMRRPDGTPIPGSPVTFVVRFSP